MPRQYLAAVLGEKRQPFTRGSGRLDLAEVIATPENPLTARVMVNRVWLGHFGQGLVNTPSDFGLRGENPSHPELLDWLATTFATGEMGADLSAAEPVKAARPARRRSRGKMGAVKAPAPNTQHLTPSAPWSVKSLHRLMLLSNTYQQSSEAGPAVAKADPDNRLLSHFSRRRLDFEQLRDAMLAVTGTLDETLYGRSVNVIGNLETGRRTVYAFIDRQDLPTLLRTFDYPDANAHSGARFSTVVPQQSLFLMNNEFVQDRARKLLDQPVISSAKTADEKIKQLYRALF
ncbi:MAG: Planctomycete cytochrome, partial [Armatimonadetes bacterium]|nr:Planctomycete cytochrome [Armatimonadota bacterium]